MKKWERTIVKLTGELKIYMQEFRTRIKEPENEDSSSSAPAPNPRTHNTHAGSVAGAVQAGGDVGTPRGTGWGVERSPSRSQGAG